MRRRRRLRGAESFKRLRRLGRRWRHPLVVLVAVPNQLPYTRFAFSASKRVGNATERNRAKRLLREAARQELENVEPGWDCLLVAQSATPAAALKEVSNALKGLLGQAGVFLPAPLPARVEST